MQHFHSQPGLQSCPSCHNHSLAQTSLTHYKCLLCGFSRNLARSHAGLPLPAFLVPFMLLFFLL